MQPFYALISRMKNITRWSLMRNTFSENVQEHSHMVAVIAHALALYRRDVLGLPALPELAAAAALFHDATEILTGDMPTPVKYHSPGITDAYKQIERQAGDRLLAGLPEDMRRDYGRLLSPDEETARLVKAADRISAYIKCVEELKAGNQEFASAARQTRERISAMHMPEADWFMAECVPAFELTLDELQPENG